MLSVVQDQSLAATTPGLPASRPATTRAASTAAASCRGVTPAGGRAASGKGYVFAEVVHGGLPKSGSPTSYRLALDINKHLPVARRHRPAAGLRRRHPLPKKQGVGSRP